MKSYADPVRISIEDLCPHGLRLADFILPLGLGTGDIPLLPAPKDPSMCMSRSLVRDWWNRAEVLAELERPRAVSR